MPRFQNLPPPVRSLHLVPQRLRFWQGGQEGTFPRASHPASNALATDRKLMAGTFQKLALASASKGQNHASRSVDARYCSVSGSGRRPGNGGSHRDHPTCSGQKELKERFGQRGRCKYFCHAGTQKTYEHQLSNSLLGRGTAPPKEFWELPRQHLLANGSATISSQGSPRVLPRQSRPPCRQPVSYRHRQGFCSFRSWQIHPISSLLDTESREFRTRPICSIPDP